MKKFTLLALLSLSLLLTSCVKIFIERRTGYDGPILVEAEINGKEFISNIGAAKVDVFKDNSFLISMGFTDANSLLDLVGDMHTLIMGIYGTDFDDVKVGGIFTENHIEDSLTAENPRNFIALHFVGNLLEDDFEKFIGVTALEGGEGEFIVTRHDKRDQILSGDFSFTSVDDDGNELTIRFGSMMDVEYEIEYSEYNSLNEALRHR